MITKIFIILISNYIIASVSGVPEESLSNGDESRLMEYLFKHKKYDHLVYPVNNLTNVVNVKFDLSLIQIIDVEENKQSFKSIVWVKMNWVDPNLSWEPSKYNGIKILNVSPKNVWRPEIELNNNADENYARLWPPDVLIQFNGEILWIPPAVYETSCIIILDFFPFDEHSCEIRFGSRNFNSKQISFSWFGKSKLDLSSYWKSRTWDIISSPAEIKNSTSYSSGINTQEIIYKITIRRKTNFYTVILILTCILLSLLTVCIFYLPPNDDHKITITVSILLTLNMLFQLICKLIPSTSISDLLISKYLLFIFIVNFIAIVIGVILINLNNQTHYMPTWVRMVFIEFFPSLIKMRKTEYTKELTDKKKKDNISPSIVNPQQRLPIRKEKTISNYFLNLKPNSRKLIRIIDSQVSITLMGEKIEPDWKFVASVINRLMYLVFTTVMLIGTATLFLRGPFFYNWVDDRSNID